MWKDLYPPIIIGHRGSSIDAPENTLSAFDLALKKKADAVEFDVKLTADGEVVIIHDATVDRTTTGRGKVSHFSLEKIKLLDAGEKFSEKFIGEKIPTLSEVFEIFGKTLHMNIELTNYTTPNDGLAEKVAGIAKKYKMQEMILFSSFLPRNLKIVARLTPDVPRGLLARPYWAGWYARNIGLKLSYFALHPYHKDISGSLVNKAHRFGKCINAWTINGKEEIMRVAKLDVDGIITDDPGVAYKILREGQAQVLPMDYKGNEAK